MLGQPMGEALATLAVPDRVRAALVDGGGPYQPLLELVRAIESESAPEIRVAADAAYIEPLEINRALLKTLFLAATLDRSRARNG
jgi:EAL and modified HD-GYP domain-containing signal transduction protein